jgi:hypothetical protein
MGKNIQEQKPALGDKDLAKLNAQISQRLRRRKSSFFAPQFNGIIDPTGLEAFHAGDLGPTDQSIEVAVAQKAAENTSKP